MSPSGITIPYAGAPSGASTNAGPNKISSIPAPSPSNFQGGKPTGSAPSPPASAPWLSIREDLKLEKGPITRSGAPTWTIHDPVAHRFFRIGWLEFEILSRWGIADPQKIADSIVKNTPIFTDLAQVETFFKFLVANDLLVNSSAAGSALLAKKRQNSRPNLIWRILTRYLYFRIPLVRPDSFLKSTLPLVRWIFSPGFFFLTLVLSLFGALLVIGQWSQFIHGFNFLATPDGILFFLTALFLSKCLHEMGHGYAAVKYGCSVPTMGLGMMIFWPILWTDTTQAWKVRRRIPRLVISAAGIYIEIIIAVFSTLIWILLPEGPLRSAIQMLATSTWLITLLVNLNPLMKFDGYFLLSDFLEIPNLQPRAFATARWWYRKYFLGLNHPLPDGLPSDQVKVLVFYGISVWIYRLFLYMSIALAIYFFFFKLLGILMLIFQVIFYFIPLVKEIKFISNNRGGIRLLPNGILTLVLAGSFIALFIVPWQSSLMIPAILKAEREYVIYAPSAAKIKQILVSNGESVDRDELIILLDSPEIDHRISQTLQKIEQLEMEMERNQFHEASMGENVVKLQEYNSLTASLGSYLEEKKALSIKAPFGGVVTDMPLSFKEKDWIPKKEMLGLITGNSHGDTPGSHKKESIVGYIRETRLPDLYEGQTAMFYPDGYLRHRLKAVIESINPAAVENLTHPELASIYGGRLPIQQDKRGNLVPARSVYKVTLLPMEKDSRNSKSGPSPGINLFNTSRHIMTGQVKIQTQPTSIFQRFWIHALGVFVRESGL